MKRVELEATATPKHKLGLRMHAVDANLDPSRKKLDWRPNNRLPLEKHIQSKILNKMEPDMCRVCAEKTDSNVSLFTNGSVNISGLRLSRLIQVDIFPNDGLPVNMCNICNNKINMIMEFQKSARLMHYQYLDLVELSVSKPDTPQLIDDLDDLSVEYLSDEFELDSMNEKELKETQSYQNISKANVPIVELIDINAENLTEEIDHEFVWEEVLVEPQNESQPTLTLKSEPSKQSDWSGSDDFEDQYTSRNKVESFIKKTRKENVFTSCDICGKKLRVGSLKVHYSRHTVLRTAKCSVCSKCFKNDSDLKIHMRSHTDIRRFVCYICGFRFKNSSGLTNHVQNHSDAKNFKCSKAKCTKSFNTRLALNRHIRMLHEKQFSCSICQKGFGTRRKAVRHLESHTRSGMDVTEAREKLLSIVIPHWAQVD